MSIRFWENTLTPSLPLNQHFALIKKLVLTMAQGRGRWGVFQDFIATLSFWVSIIFCSFERGYFSPYKRTNYTPHLSTILQMQTLTCWWKHKETLQSQKINLIWSRLLSPKMAAEEGKITSGLLLICQ